MVRPSGCSQAVGLPFYTIHKIMAGMFDMYQFAGNKQALEVLEGMSGWADTWSASKSEAHMQDILNTEYGGMNDILYKLAGATGEDRWAKAATVHQRKAFSIRCAAARRTARLAREHAHPAGDRRCPAL